MPKGIHPRKRWDMARSRKESIRRYLTEARKLGRIRPEELDRCTYLLYLAWDAGYARGRAFSDGAHRSTA